jgi:hypothetical protein
LLNPKPNTLHPKCSCIPEKKKTSWAFVMHFFFHVHETTRLESLARKHNENWNLIITSLNDCFYTVTLSVFPIGRIYSNWTELSPNCRFCCRSSGLHHFSFIPCILVNGLALPPSRFCQLRRSPPTHPPDPRLFSHKLSAKVRVALADSVESPAHSLSLSLSLPYNNSSMNMMKM